MGEWAVYKFPSSNSKECPRLHPLEHAISIAEFELRDRLFIGKRKLRERIASLQEQRNSIVAECQSEQCPGPQQETAQYSSGNYNYVLPRECGIAFVERASKELLDEATLLVQGNINESMGEE